jgi:Domain of unknown function (DUF4082)/Bacterial Ig-like domain/Bacterial Ig domain
MPTGGIMRRTVGFILGSFCLPAALVVGGVPAGNATTTMPAAHAQAAKAPKPAKVATTKAKPAATPPPSVSVPKGWHPPVPVLKGEKREDSDDGSPGDQGIKTHRLQPTKVIKPPGMTPAESREAAAAGSGPCGTGGNPTACENSLAGSPSSQWDVDSGGGQTIAGFSTQFSVNIGQTINFKILTTASSYTMDIYRMGYYGGDGARHIASVPITAHLPQTQPKCLTDPTTGLVDCGNWAVSASWAVPSTAVSGIYFAHIVRTDTVGGVKQTDDNHIVFVVRNDASHSDIVFKTSDETWQAYNDWGDTTADKASLYAGSSQVGVNPNRAVKVSYNRPFETRNDTPWGRDFVFANEYPMVRFLEAQGYDVSYIGSADVDQQPTLLKNHKIFLSVGHDEYWSAAERTNVTAARDAGVSLAFFSGNSIFWKTRWENSIDGTNTAYRTLVTYKSTHEDAQTDPTGLWTGSWRDPRFSPPADGGLPENQLQGTLWMVNCCSYPMQVPAADGKMRFWRNTPIGRQAAGATFTLPSETLGYEWDIDPDNGFRPPGLIDMSTTTEDVDQLLIDYGNNVAPGLATHHLTLYRAPSGALVFGAGTVQWSWGLDTDHDGPDDSPTATDPSMRQATVNLFADMNAQPVTMTSDLSAATKSTDTTAPTSTITSPAPNATLPNGKTITITGTATDAGGGQVGGVEVSTDGGSTWHPAVGRGTWTYSWDVLGDGPMSIKTRATDDSGNIESPGAGVTINATCPCSLWGQSAVPVNSSTNDATPLESGVKFSSSVDGWIAGVKFYKGTGNTGTHIGNLWDSTGHLLATANFTNETATGWQSVTFPTAIHVTAGTTYVASYFAPNGHYDGDASYFSLKPLLSPPLTAPQATTTSGNGVYNAGADAFPTTTYSGGNYWVDPIFDLTQPPDTVAPSVTATTPYAGSSSVSTSVFPSVTFSKAVTPGSPSFVLKDPSGGIVTGGASLDATNSIDTFVPTAALAANTTYTATISGATDRSANLMTPYTFTFTTAKAPPAAGTCPCSIWTDTTTPAVEGVNDPSALELGVKFTADQSGFVSGIRFYKGRNNTGTHTGTLWSATGTSLATATFSGESTLGWQQVSFSSPVAVTAGITYVASYHTTTGWFSADAGGLAKAVDDSPLHTVADGANGVFVYGAHAFPTQSYNSTNYWVDVVFTLPPDTTAPAVVSTGPSNKATSVPAGAPVKATFSEPVQAGTVAMTVKNSAGTAVAGTTALDSTARILTFTPTSPLAASTAYTATVNGAKDAAGNTMTTAATWSFTTSGTASCPCTLWESDATPTMLSANDSGSVELGVKFSSDTAGWISGVRFYKSTLNTGTHTGSLWGTDGTLLATGTFTNETASGWQTLSFPHPMQVTAGTTYVASYHAPNGHYAADGNYFATGYDNAPLHAPSDATATNGVYNYSATSSYPSASYGSTNYWVDPIFSVTQPPSSNPPTVSVTDPVSGQTSVPPGDPITATFDEPVQSGTTQFTVTGPGGTTVPGSVTLDGTGKIATFTPTSALAWHTAYTVKVNGAKDAAGNTMTTAATWSFTSAVQTTAGVCPCSVWPDATLPQVADVNDPSAIELGMDFQTGTAGYITGIRFYKGVLNTGTHIGNLWTSTGQLLATATFTGESSAGWQQVNFTTAVPVAANTTYVVSYHTSSGYYSADANAFAGAGVESAPLMVPQATTGAPNGVYLYGGSSAFPTSGSTSNYWVDPVFNTVPSQTQQRNANNSDEKPPLNPSLTTPSVSPSRKAH